MYTALYRAVISSVHCHGLFAICRADETVVQEVSIGGIVVVEHGNAYADGTACVATTQSATNIQTGDISRVLSININSVNYTLDILHSSNGCAAKSATTDATVSTQAKGRTCANSQAYSVAGQLLAACSLYINTRGVDSALLCIGAVILAVTDNLRTAIA